MVAQLICAMTVTPYAYQTPEIVDYANRRPCPIEEEEDDYADSLSVSES